MLIMEDRGYIHLEKSTKGKLEKFNKMRGKVAAFEFHMIGVLKHTVTLLWYTYGNIVVLK